MSTKSTKTTTSDDVSRITMLLFGHKRTLCKTQRGRVVEVIVKRMPQDSPRTPHPSATR